MTTNVNHPRLLRSHFWADYTSQELAELGKAGGIAVIPVAAIEQHGPHLPVSVDTCILNGLIDASAKKFKALDAPPPVLFLPTLPFGKSNEHAQYPGTITVSVQTLIALWMEVGRCVAASGFKKVMYYNSHGGQASVMDIVSRDLRAECDVIAMHCNWYMLGAPPAMYSEHELRFGIHAGDMETSMMLALSGENVQRQHMKNFASSTEGLLKEGYKQLQVSQAAKIAWQTQDLNLAGAAGDASNATVERGIATIDFVAEKFVGLMQEVHRLPLGYLKNINA